MGRRAKFNLGHLVAPLQWADATMEVIGSTLVIAPVPGLSGARDESGCRLDVNVQLKVSPKF